MNAHTAPAAGPAALESPLVQTFMTHRMSDRAIQLLNTGRERETARLRDALQRSLRAAPGSLQHVVIYGPRGFGKSFMTRLAQIEARSLAAAEGVAIPFVLLPEEQHNLTRNPSALPDYIAHRLADLRTGRDSSWAAAMFQWPDPEGEARQWSEAVKRLEAELDLSLPDGRGLAVVAIENFDALLFGVFKDSAAEQRLRKWLDRPGNRLMLLATATGSVDMDYERPLFQAFQPLRLEPWTPQTCVAYFERRRAAEGREPLSPIDTAKARAVADFIGGNPRLAQLLADVLDTHDAMSVVAIMNALADKLADYYRRRIDDLPGLAQGLLDALIRGGEPASQTELARRVGADSQATIARTMQDLQRADVVRGSPSPDSRETLYRVIDRVFVHFYRVRQGQQMALRTPLATILDFLQAFYSRDEQRDQALRALNEDRPAEARLFADLSRQGAASTIGNAFGFIEGFRWRWQRFDRLLEEACPWQPEALLALLDASPERAELEARRWLPQTALGRAARAAIRVQALARLDLRDAAVKLLGETIASVTEPETLALLLWERSRWRWSVEKDTPASIEDCQAISELDLAAASATVRALSLRAVAMRAGHVGRHDEAVGAAHEAAALALQADDPGEQAVCLRNAAWSLGQLGRHEEAVRSAQEAAALALQADDPGEQAVCLGHAAWSLEQLDRHEDAVRTAQEAAALALQANDPGVQARCLGLAAWLLGGLGRHEEAVRTAQEAAALALRANDPPERAECLGHAAWSLGQLGRHEEAVRTAQEAAALALQANHPREQAVCLRHAAWSLWQLGRHEEVVRTAQDAAALALQANYLSEQAVCLRYAARSLDALGRKVEALDTWLAAQAVALRAANLAEVEQTTIACLRAAAQIPSAAAVRAFADWLALDVPTTQASIDSWPGLWLMDWLATAVRAGAWAPVDEALAQHARVLAQHQNLYGNEAGEAIARTAEAEGRAAGFTAARELLPRLKRLAALREGQPESHQEVFERALADIVTGLAVNCRDPGLLQDIAGLLTADLSPGAPNQAALLRALAQLDAAPVPQPFLARADPDLAIWLRQVRGLEDADLPVRGVAGSRSGSPGATGTRRKAK